jgi:hypothetical protein
VLVDQLVGRLRQDFWPKEEEMEMMQGLSSLARHRWGSSDQDVLERWELLYCGIFLLDVAEKILANVINGQLEELIEETVSDSQKMGFKPGGSPHTSFTP